MHRSRSPRRPPRSLATALALTVFAVFAVVAVPGVTSPAAAAATLTVTPDTGLVPGNEPDVTGSGFTPGAGVEVCLTALPVTTATASPCGGFHLYTSAFEDGTLYGFLQIYRYLFIPALGRWVDCNDPSETCAAIAFETADPTGSLVAVPLDYADPPAPPAQRGTIDLVPATGLVPGAIVTVLASGFRPNSFVDLYECASDSLQVADCELRAGLYYTGDEGSFEGGFPVDGVVTRYGRAPVDCAAAGSCVLAAAESADFESTVVAGPLTFLPGPTITITPPSGAVPGRDVVVAGAGFPPGPVEVCQRLLWSDACGPSWPRTSTDAAADGTFTTTLTIDRTLQAPPWAYDCQTDTCAIVATSVATGANRGLPLTLAPVPAPPATRGAIRLAPDGPVQVGDAVTITGTGFRPDATVDLYQCAADPTGPAGCSMKAAVVVADASGGFEASILAAERGGAADCVAGDACVLAAAEEVDFTGTVVSAPIDVRTVPVLNVATGRIGESSSGSTLVVRASLAQPVRQPIAVSWTTGAGPYLLPPATPGADYAPTGGTFTFAPGQTTATVSVDVVDDDVFEGNEYVFLTFTSDDATVAFGGTTWGLIEDDETEPVIMPGRGWGLETDTSSTIDVPFTLSGPSAFPVTMPWRTVDLGAAYVVPASAGSHHPVAQGEVTFAPGQTTVLVEVAVTGDDLPEATETFGVVIDRPVNAQRLPGLRAVGLATIVDDDVPVVIPGTASVAEGDDGTVVASVPVSLSMAWDQPVTVMWTTLAAPGVSAQAAPPDDYLTASGSVTFLPGETTATVPITVVGDTSVEPDEFLLVSFATSTPLVRLGGVWGLGALTIADDD